MACSDLKKEKSAPVGVGYVRSWIDQWRLGSDFKPKPSVPLMPLLLYDVKQDISDYLSGDNSGSSLQSPDISCRADHLW